MSNAIHNKSKHSISTIKNNSNINIIKPPLLHNNKYKYSHSISKDNIMRKESKIESYTTKSNLIKKTLSLNLHMKHNTEKNTIKQSTITTKNSNSNLISEEKGNNVVNILNGVNDKNVEINFNNFEIKIIPDNDNTQHQGQTSSLLLYNNNNTDNNNNKFLSNKNVLNHNSIPKLNEIQSSNSLSHYENSDLAPISTSSKSVIKLYKQKSRSLSNNFNTIHNHNSTSLTTLKEPSNQQFQVTTQSTEIINIPIHKTNTEYKQRLQNTNTQFTLLMPCRQNTLEISSFVNKGYSKLLSNNVQFENKNAILNTPKTYKYQTSYFSRNKNSRRLTFTQTSILHNKRNKNTLHKDELNIEQFGSISSISESELKEITKKRKFSNSNTITFKNEKDNNNRKRKMSLIKRNSSFFNNNQQHTNNNLGITNSNNYNNNIIKRNSTKKITQEQILFELGTDKDDNDNYVCTNFKNFHNKQIVYDTPKAKQLKLTLKGFDSSNPSSDEGNASKQNQNEITSNKEKKENNFNQNDNNQNVSPFFLQRSFSNQQSNLFLYKNNLLNQKKRTNVLNLLPSFSSSKKTHFSKQSSRNDTRKFSTKKYDNSKSQKKIMKQLSNIHEIFTRQKDNKLKLNNKISQFTLFKYCHMNCKSECKLPTFNNKNNLSIISNQSKKTNSLLLPKIKDDIEEIISRIKQANSNTNSNSSLLIPNSSSKISSSKESSSQEESFYEKSRFGGRRNSITPSKQGTSGFFDIRSPSVMSIRDIKYCQSKKIHTDKEVKFLNTIKNQIDDVYQNVFDESFDLETKESLLNKVLLMIDVECNKYQEKSEQTLNRLTMKKMSQVLDTKKLCDYLEDEQFLNNNNDNNIDDNILFENDMEKEYTKQLYRNILFNTSPYVVSNFFDLNLAYNIYKDKYLETDIICGVLPKSKNVNSNNTHHTTIFKNFSMFTTLSKSRSTRALFKRKSKKTVLSRTILPINTKLNYIEFSNHLWTLLMHNKVEALPPQDKQFYWSFVIKDCLKHSLEYKPLSEFILNNFINKFNNNNRSDIKQTKLIRESPKRNTRLKKSVYNRLPTNVFSKKKSINFNFSKKSTIGNLNKVFNSQSTLLQTPNFVSNHKKEFSILNSNKLLYEREFVETINNSYDDNRSIKKTEKNVLSKNLFTSPLKRKKKRCMTLCLFQEAGKLAKKEITLYTTNKIKSSLIKRFRNHKDILFFYIKDGNAEQFINTFLKFKMNTETKDKEGNSFLNLAVQCDCLKVINFLLNHGANVNTQNKKLNAPLHYALSCQNFIISDLLIKSGADENIRNSKGVTPWQCLNNQFSIM